MIVRRYLAIILGLTFPSVPVPGRADLSFVSDTSTPAYDADPGGGPANLLGVAQPGCGTASLPNPCLPANLSSIPGAIPIWGPGVDSTSPADLQQFFFSVELDLPTTPTAAMVSVAADDLVEVIVNGASVATVGSISDPAEASAAQMSLHSIDIAAFLTSGTNILTMRAQNGPGSFSGKPCQFDPGGCTYADNPAQVVFGGAVSFPETTTTTTSTTTSTTETSTSTTSTTETSTTTSSTTLSTTTTSSTSTSTTATSTTSTSTTSTSSMSTTTTSTLVPTSTTTSTSAPTSSSTSLPPTTTTTVPAGGCDGVPDGPTFGSIRCRLEALRIATMAASELGDMRPKLDHPLGKALDRTAAAETACASDKVKGAKARLGQVIRQLIQYSHRLRGMKARKTAPESVREPLASAADRIQDDAKTLRRIAHCPSDAA